MLILVGCLQDWNSLKSEQFQKEFQMLGETLVVSEEVNEICEEFVCKLYGSKLRSVPGLYYHLCCA